MVPEATKPIDNHAFVTSKRGDSCDWSIFPEDGPWTVCDYPRSAHRPSLPITPTKWVRRGSRMEELGAEARGPWHLAIVGAHGLPLKRSLCGVSPAFHGNLAMRWWDVKSYDEQPEKECRKCVELNHA